MQKISGKGLRKTKWNEVSSLSSSVQTPLNLIRRNLNICKLTKKIQFSVLWLLCDSPLQFHYQRTTIAKGGCRRDTLREFYTLEGSTFVNNKVERLVP